MRETFFFNQMRVNNEMISSKKADFVIDGYRNVIPLWAFGLNY